MSYRAVPPCADQRRRIDRRPPSIRDANFIAPRLPRRPRTTSRVSRCSKWNHAKTGPREPRPANRHRAREPQPPRRRTRATSSPRGTKKATRSSLFAMTLRELRRRIQVSTRAARDRQPLTLVDRPRLCAALRRGAPGCRYHDESCSGVSITGSTDRDGVIRRQRRAYGAAGPQTVAPPPASGYFRVPVQHGWSATAQRPHTLVVGSKSDHERSVERGAQFRLRQSGLFPRDDRYGSVYRTAGRRTPVARRKVPADR